MTSAYLTVSTITCYLAKAITITDCEPNRDVGLPRVRCPRAHIPWATRALCFIKDRYILMEFLNHALNTDTNWFQDDLTPLHVATSDHDEGAVHVILTHVKENIKKYRYVLSQS